MRDEAKLRKLSARAFGQEPRAIERVPAGLGLRRFWRLRFDAPPYRVIARIEADEDPAGRPAGAAPEPPLEPIRAHLAEHAIRVPSRLASDAAAGIELLEDAGDVTLESVASTDAELARELVARVADDVVRLQAIPPAAGVAAYRRQLDAATFAYKGELFAEWSLPVALGRDATAAERAEVAAAFRFIANESLAAPQRLAHRDLQSRNLLVHGDEVVWIDLQGAFMAPPEYDLVCLLRDSYVEWPEATVEAVCERVRPRLPDAPEPDAFAARFALLTLSRKGKDHARFQYIEAVRGQTPDPAHRATTVRHLKRAALQVANEAPALERLSGWIEALPEEAP